MLGEIVIGVLFLVAFAGLIVYYTRPKLTVKASRSIRPMPPVYKEYPTRVATASTRSTVKASTPPPRPQYPSGGSTQHDTQSSDLLSTVLILDAMDTADNYSSPAVDTYSAPSYSGSTQSSYSSDDSCSRSSYSSSSSYSDSSSSYSSSDSSSSSSSSSSCD